LASIFRIIFRQPGPTGTVYYKPMGHSNSDKFDSESNPDS
jgi:hypothetical protein